MFIYGKTTTNAIAVMSYLATDPDRRVGSAEIAQARNISQSLTAKLLTQLSTAGLVSGIPGPGGGYTLAKSADDICLMDIASLFEQTDTSTPCPFGPNYCGTGNPCPMHDTLMVLLEKNDRFMRGTKLKIFQKKSR